MKLIMDDKHERERQRMRDRYARDPQKERDRKRRYRMTAAGMLTETRHHAKQRGNR